MYLYRILNCSWCEVLQICCYHSAFEYLLLYPAFVSVIRYFLVRFGAFGILVASVFCGTFRLNICFVVLLSALKTACSSAMIFFHLSLESVYDDLTEHDCAWMTDKVNGSGILKQLQIPFL